MRQTREILRLRHQGPSLRDIGRSLGIGSTTVRDVLARDGGEAHVAVARRRRRRRAGGAAIRRLLGRVRRPLLDFAGSYRHLARCGVTLELLRQEYRGARRGDGYGHSRPCDLYRTWRALLDVVRRQAHRAGKKLFVDSAGMLMPSSDAATGAIGRGRELDGTRRSLCQKLDRPALRPFPRAASSWWRGG